MAPAESKHAANGFGAKLRSAFSAQLKELGEDLLEIGMFVCRCIEDVGHRLHNSTAPLVGAMLKLLEVLRRMHYHAGLHSRRTKCRTEGKNSSGLEHTLPMCFVLYLIGLLYSAFTVVYMPAAGLSMRSPVSMLFHAFVFLSLASYVQVYMTDPGLVPEGPAWRIQDLPPPHLQERKTDGKGARWCRKSLVYKPDRAHFCQMTGRVVLKMDHHCPWFGTTIGFANHKHFILFLSYMTSSCLIANIDIARLLVGMRLPPGTAHFLFGCEGIMVMMSSVLVPFLGFHLWLLSQNMTTIEFIEKHGAPRAGNKEDESPRYDIGLLRNLTAVLGTNPLLWLLPVASTPGDGLSFPMRSRDGDGLIGLGRSNGSGGHSSPVQSEDGDEPSLRRMLEVRRPLAGSALLLRDRCAGSQSGVDHVASTPSSTTASEQGDMQHSVGANPVCRPRHSNKASSALRVVPVERPTQQSLRGLFASFSCMHVPDTFTCAPNIFCKGRWNPVSDHGARARSIQTTVAISSSGHPSHVDSSSNVCCNSSINHRLRCQHFL